VESFATALRKHIVVGDGAMGSLVARELPQENPSAMARSILEVNLTHPEIIHAIHLGYIGAGANLITTNTFGASPIRLARLGLGEHVREIVSTAVKIAREAREASGQPVWIAGSISPLDPDWLLDADPPVAEQHRQFEEQVGVLLERGADLILLETFSRLEDLLLAVQAVRHVDAAVPIVAHMTFDETGEMESGESPEEAARRIDATGMVQAVGVNCSLGPQASLAVLEALAPGTGLPLSIMPNAGFAQRLGGRVLYPDMSRSYWEGFARGALELGARILGGCCGTTPDQIAVLHDVAAEEAPGPLRRARPAPPPRRQATPVVGPRAEGHPRSQFARKLEAGEFLRTLQLDPQRGPTDLLNREVVETVRSSPFVDLVDINSSGGSARQDSLQIAAGIERLGVETMAHITPRDASLQGVLAQVLGAHDWGGVRNVLVIIGDPPKGDLYAEAKGVYQVDTIGLVRALDRLRRGRAVNDRVTLQPFELGIGVALNQNAPDVRAELDRLERKIEAGADFVMTQPFFDIEDWMAFRERLVGRFTVPFLLGVWPLVSARQARRINENVAGVAIPERICRRLEEAGATERQLGFELAARLVADLERTRSAAGVYVVAPFKQPSQGLEVLERAAATGLT